MEGGKEEEKGSGREKKDFNGELRVRMGGRVRKETKSRETERGG